MRHYIAFVAALLLFGSSARAQDDQQKLLGVWTISSSDAPGVELKLTFTAKQFRFHMPAGAGRLQAYKIDASTKPRAIDLANRSGIYEFDGDKLKICLAAAGKPRPDEFDAKAGTGKELYTFKRDA